jgi:glycosyltransferase involved in cell wall biosynthesis
MKQKVVQVVTQMEAGGAQRAALLLHHEMLRQGVEAELWFLYAKTAAYAGETAVRSLWPRRLRLHELPLLWLRVWQSLRHLRPHILITHTHYANAFAQPVARLLNIPTRLAVHHNELHTYPAPARLLERWLKYSGIFSTSIAVSESVRCSLINASPPLYSRSTRRIYNGLPRSADSIDPPAGSPDLLRRLSGHRILFTAGRLTHQKNHRALIASLELLPDCMAVIAGRGSLETELREQADELGVAHRLHFLGEIGSQQVTQWMRGSDVFVFPSLFEAMPMALLEAMRNGMTIVASDIPAHRELAGDTAILSDTDPHSLATAIRRALEHPRDQLGKKAQARSHNFTVEAMANAYLEIH